MKTKNTTFRLEVYDMNVIKRNGDIVPFDQTKIIHAINSAFIDVDG